MSTFREIYAKMVDAQRKDWEIAMNAAIPRPAPLSAEATGARDVATVLLAGVVVFAFIAWIVYWTYQAGYRHGYGDGRSRMVEMRPETE